jgi:hypothetical protein
MLRAAEISLSASYPHVGHLKIFCDRSLGFVNVFVNKQ